MPAPGENPQRDAETQVPMLIAMSVAFVSVSSVVVLLRLYTRYVVVSSPGPDDITIAIAQVLSIGVSVSTILQAKYSLGRHVWMVSQDDGIKQLKALFAAMVTYNLAQIITKTSFLFQYRRIFQEGRTRRACLWLMFFLAVWGVAQEVLVGFACTPAGVFIHNPVCIDSLTVYYLTSIMNIVTDFIVFMIPMPAIRALQLPRRQKILVTSVFCLGFFTCIISIVRLFTLHSAINTTDPTWDNVPSAYWSVVELNCGILCASLPPLRPLLRRFNITGMSHHGGIGRSGGDGYDRGGDRSIDHKPHASHISHAGASAVSGGGGGGIYPLKDISASASASQEGLNEHAAETGSSSYYQAPEYATRHGGRFKTSRLTTDIQGGKSVSTSGTMGRLSGSDDDNASDYSSSGGHGPAVPSKDRPSGIRITREIDYEKESIKTAARSGRRKPPGVTATVTSHPPPQ